MNTPSDQVFSSPTTPTGAATPSQFPQGGATTTTDGSSGGNWLSTLGSGIGNFISQNQGLIGGAATAGVGLYQAGQATKAGQQAAGQIQSTVAPAQAVGAGTYGQLTGGPSVGGPLGTAITGQTTAAAELTGVAQQYGTGQLTSAQQTQIQQQVAAQRAQADQQLAASGNMNSSARDAKYQQIDNNAAILSQQLINQNISMAEGAQTSVMNTYNSLLSNALSSSELGLKGTEAAVNTLLQNNKDVQAALQQIMSGITTGLATASGGGAVAQQGGKAGGTTPLGQAGAAIGTGLQNLFGGGTPAVSASDLANYSAQGSAAIAAMPVQSLNLSNMDTSGTGTGWGGYTANNIDYTGYTGG